MGEQRRIALVTGAGTGIGKAVSAALADEAWTVVLAGRRAAPLDDMVRELGRRGHDAAAIATDVCDPNAVRQLFERIRLEFGRLDLLFNNAGVTAPPTPIDELPVEAWKTVIDTNLTGVFLCTREAFRLMKSQHPRGGRIINNGSISAHVPRPHSAAYTASKHAVLGLTRSTALDGRPFDIACGQIDIGNAATALGADLFASALQASGSVAAEPTIDTAHVARAVVYMAGLPLEANVLTLTVMATKMPYVGRG
jgi:NAD(P)-dependent dehydrogenase (short-subunit alcohol dehydrogenase family)